MNQSLIERLYRRESGIVERCGRSRELLVDHDAKPLGSLIDADKHVRSGWSIFTVGHRRKEVAFKRIADFGVGAFDLNRTAEGMDSELEVAARGHG